MEEIFNRSVRLLGNEAMQRLSRARVILFGVGGVGSWCAEGLIRSGIVNLTIVDYDQVSITNVNRQLMATSRTVGRVKVEALKERLLEINPNASITAIRDFYTKENSPMFNLGEYDYIIDCIDSLKDKMNLLVDASGQSGATVFSSMGAALKMDPTQIRVAEFWKVRGCPLGAAMRKRMKQRDMHLGKKVMCVYSEEVLENKGDIATAEGLVKKAQVNGSLVHITAIFGFTLSGLVIRHCTEGR